MAGGRRDEPGGAARAPARFADISTHWSVLKGPPRLALDHLYRTYGRAVLSYLRGRLARGDFHPLREGDAEDILQDFFLRLGQSEWLAKPDARRGRFRPYFVRRLVFFLRERRAAALGRPASEAGEEAERALAESPAPDDLDARLEQEWRLATVDVCLRRLGRRNESRRRALEAHLSRGDRSDPDVASSLGWSVDAFRSHLKRARSEFREMYAAEESRLDGFGGAEFDAGE